ncbi:hypothetical protein D9M69_564010 [compost metagenome]
MVPNLGVQRAHARLLLQRAGQHLVHRLDLLIEGLGQLVELRQQTLLLLVCGIGYGDHSLLRRPCLIAAGVVARIMNLCESQIRIVQRFHHGAEIRRAVVAVAVKLANILRVERRGDPCVYGGRHVQTP